MTTAPFAQLGPPYTVVALPTPLPGARRLIDNEALAATLGLDPTAWQGAEGLDRLSGQQAWPGYAARASAYAGHQFGRYTRRLGDGRACLVAELATPAGPVELQLKGAGPTPYARGGDGRLVLRAALREYLACEALHALGVPTTRALALVASPLTVLRDGQAEPTAVLARTAPSFLRFGHFEYHAAEHGAEAVAALADHVIVHHHPHLADIDDARERHAVWLTEGIGRQAALIAQWQTLGFCHGVINTDNAAILGLTLDLGPYGFMERFRAHHVCNASDTEGRYAYAAQPSIGQWNCERLIDACSALLTPADATTLRGVFAPAYARAVMQRWRAKLGLALEQDGDAALVNQLLTLMQQARCDFTLTFRALADEPLVRLRERFAAVPAFDAWWAQWQRRVAFEGVSEPQRRERQRRANPRVVLRNALAQQAVDAVLAGDPGPLHTLLKVLERPFDTGPIEARYAAPSTAAVEVGCSS